MAHAQAQAQVQSSSQYRHHHHHHHHHSSNQHASPTIQSQQQFPPRTHRRSIQPLTLEQQQPKGGSFRYVRNQADLWPQKGSQKYRSIDALGHSISPLRALTDLLTKTYSHCNRDFKYEPSYNPRRVLTKPSKPVHNEGYDNEDYDYILYVSDILGSEERQRYLILDVLGQGTFGQVVKCQNLKTNAIVAVKVIKNKPAYFNQSMMEVTVLELLNERYDMDDRHHILRLQDTFIHRRHLCLVFELLSVNLYELIKQNQFRGLSMSLVRVFTAQLLDALCVLSEARIIHCDLKPENVLLKNLETPTIKVIDFGSACHEQQTVYTYIQSRFYRSPEVLVGLPYSSSIDIWSVGCIAAELFLGLPLFPGSSEYNQLSRIVEMLGMLPTYMLDIGKTAHEFFEVIRPDFPGHNYTRPAPKKYRLKSMEAYSKEHRVIEQPSKRYFQATTLPDIVNSYPMLKKGMTPKEIEKETISRQSFINFLQGLLNLNPIERWSPHQAKLHPFITGEPFTGSFIPPTIPKKPSTAENSARLEPTLPGRASKARSASLSTSSSAPTFAASHTVNEKPAMLRQQPKADQRSSLRNVDPVASQPQSESSRSGADPTEIHAQPPLSALGGSMATLDESLVDSSLIGTSSTDQYPLSVLQSSTMRTPSPTAMAAESAQTALMADTQAQTSSGAQDTATLPLSASVQHQHRPRATTMGTVGVPKNMAQLAAAMTPQQHQAPSGISGISSLSQRVGPVDATARGTFDLSPPFTGTNVTLGAVGGNGYGLRQIPERSEQNSPVLEDSVGASSGISSQGSSEDPSRQSSQHSHVTPPQQQHRRLSHRYLHRSGSDGAGKAAQSLRNIAEGTRAKKSPDNTYAQHSLAGSPSPDVHGGSISMSELTPLQRMQQQLIQSQWQQQHQQRPRYRFGYPQSGSSLSDGTSSNSGVDSNSSSRQDFLSEPEFDMEGGTLRQLDLGDSRVANDDNPVVVGEHDMDRVHRMDEMGNSQFLNVDNDTRSHIEVLGQHTSSTSSTSTSLYGHRNTGTSPHLNQDESGLPNPDSPMATSSAEESTALVASNTMGMAVSSSQVETVLSNVEEEEEGGDEGGGDSKTRENDDDLQESSEAPTRLTPACDSLFS
ncbi:hypothetical protein EDD21DRAFT_362770 [Dissophora ornata]|nr:hypothetical protein EDD21DRAFT_362770 [Dissophora ornata]